MKKLENKVVLITGSSSGIGKAIALLFADEGANIIITSNKSNDEGNKVLKVLKEKGTNCIYIKADLRNEEDIKNMFEIIEKKYGRLDVLVNNAGRTFNVSFGSLSKETLLNDLETNLVSSILCSQYAVKIMKEGRIINTSSIRGVDYSGRSGIIGYCSAKSAINSFTKTLAMELAPNILVNAVAPGFVHTNYIDDMDVSVVNNWMKDIPINRFINTDEIAEVYLLLATTNIFTGSVVVADGGYSLLNR